MTPTDINPHIPEGTCKVVYAKNQSPYLPLPTFLTPEGNVLSRWKLGPNEIELIKNGVDVYLTMYTFGHPPQAVMLTVGPPDLTTL